MKLLSLTIFVILILIPSFVLGALGLEQTYPSLPGGQTITPSSSLPSIITYIVSFIIFIAGIITLVSLILGGLQYLTSIGKPGTMAQAKSKILTSFLGVVILVGSYLLLNLINPELLVMRIEKTPVEIGVILLTDNGKSALTRNMSVEDIIKTGEAQYLSYDIKYTEKEFGKLFVSERDINNNPTEMDFKNFRPKHIGFFLGEQGQNVMVIAFSKPEFKQDLEEQWGNRSFYDFRGKINIENSSIIEGKRADKINGVKVVALDLTRTNLTFKNIGLDEQGSGEEITQNILHPPLSIALEITKPGIYLFSSNLKEKRYFSQKNKDLSLVDFNEQAEKIKIKNNAGEHDYLAILHENRYFSGNLRIFFQERTVDIGTSNEYTAGNMSLNPDNNKETSLKEINEADLYGSVNGASSINIFELNSNSQACEEVRLCTEKALNGYCVAYIPKDSAYTHTEENNNVVETRPFLPLYEPQNLKQIPVPNVPNSSEEVDFNNNIRSIKINGDCLVVLFENLENNVSGEHSDVFTKSDYDLSDNEIGLCRGLIAGTFARNKPCASSLSIYPIKPVEN